MRLVAELQAHQPGYTFCCEVTMTNSSRRFLTRRRILIAAALVLLGLTLLSVWAYRRVSGGRALDDERNQAFFSWFSGSDEDRAALVTLRGAQCEGAPFALPAEGYIGLLYADPRGPYTEARRHQGIDIFSNSGPGQTPVYAAYDGYLRRETGWISSVIMRLPEDPFQPDRQIWLYYTHMANASGNLSFILDVFPPGTREVFVQQGELIGYTGNYSGNPANPVGIHLHFSIVRSDPVGSYRNELEFDNTIDPSRYLGMPVNYACAPTRPDCSPDPLCPEAILSAGGS